MLALSLAVAAAAENEPHYHDGKLTRYEIGPPSVLLSRSDEERLSSGKPVMQAMETGIVGARRLLMVQDIAAPPNVVMDRIMDLAHYDKMVDGVTRNVEYNREQEGGLQRIKTTYDIAVLHMKMRYFMEHEYDPEKRCMTFHLDYSRRSDIDDSVGYWRATQPRCSRDAAEMCSREIAEGVCRMPTREMLPRHSRGTAER
mmetsp:Transcript_4705/g.15205  ORF Transcript_4705/g.15205 Transcript_4705/m.15205 type:complete len:200 (-) Transcript_4705:130-729(-)